MPGEIILAGIGSALIGGLLSFLALRYTARSSATVARAQLEVDQRKVDQEAFDRFVARYENERLKLVHQVDQLQGWLSSALQHIHALHEAAERGRRVPPVPSALRNIVLWHMTDGEGSPLDREDEK